LWRTSVVEYRTLPFPALDSSFFEQGVIAAGESLP
jgi:hypothetical protein